MMIRLCLRFTASAGVTISEFDEFYFLTDPKEMCYICHPHDKEKQLLTVPWTKEKFFTSPHFRQSYFSSGWRLKTSSECVIRPEDGRKTIYFHNQQKEPTLKYKLFYDEERSGKTFPQELQTKDYIRG